MIENAISWLMTNFKFSVDPKSNEVLLNKAAVADISSIISLLILMVGFFITLKTLLESIRLNKLQTLPLIHFKYTTDGGGKLSIVNSGKSAAVGIKIEKLFNVSNDTGVITAGLTVTSFKHRNFLEPGKECPVKLDSKGPWADWGEEINLYSMFREQKPVKYYVWYKDLSNKSYVMRVAVYNEDSDITGAPMVYGIRMRAILFAYLIKDRTVVMYRMVKCVYAPRASSWAKRTLKRKIS